MMKVVEKLSDFPPSTPKLRGLALEAQSLLQTITRDKPVLVIAPEGANIAALKRAFAVAAKARGQGVETRNGENGTVFVRLSSSRRIHRGAPKPPVSHSEAAIEAEMNDCIRLPETRKATSSSYLRKPDAN